MPRGAQPVDIGLLYELSYNLFVDGRATRRPTRARRNVNTDRRGARLELVHQPHRRAPISDDEIARGPDVGAPPAPERWVIIREKTAA